MWAIAEVRLLPRPTAEPLANDSAWEIAHGAAAVIGLAAFALLLFSVLGLALGTIISLATGPPLQQRESLMDRARTSILATLLLFGVASACSDLLDPGAEPQVYVLESIGGLAIGTSVNIYETCAPDVAADSGYFNMVYDSLILMPSGEGVERNLARFRYPTNQWNSGRTDTAFFSPNESSFHWLREDRKVRLKYEDYGVFDGPRVLGDDGALEMRDGMCGTWRFRLAR